MKCRAPREIDDAHVSTVPYTTKHMKRPNNAVLTAVFELNYI